MTGFEVRKVRFGYFESEMKKLNIAAGLLVFGSPKQTKLRTG
jgi:hypothetical protein